MMRLLGVRVGQLAENPPLVRFRPGYSTNTGAVTLALRYTADG